MGNLDKEIESLEKEINSKESEIERLKQLQVKFPDINKTINRWKVVRYTSSLVNSIATDCDIYFSCHCCADSSLKISPYIKTEFGNVYSEPSAFTIGERCYDGGCSSSLNWKEELLTAKLPQNIINQAEKYFKNNMSYDDMQKLVDKLQGDSS